jgi:hypothetical protein
VLGRGQQEEREDKYTPESRLRREGRTTALGVDKRQERQERAAGIRRRRRVRSAWGRRVWTPAQSRICADVTAARGVSSSPQQHGFANLSARTIQSPAWFGSLAGGILKKVVLLRQLLHFCSPLSMSLSLSYNKHSSLSLSLFVLRSSVPLLSQSPTPQCSTMQDQAAKNNVAKTPPLIRNTQNQLPRAQRVGAWVSRAPWQSICQTQYAKLIVQIQSLSFSLGRCTCILPVFPAIKI